MSSKLSSQHYAKMQQYTHRNGDNPAGRIGSHAANKEEIHQIFGEMKQTFPASHQASS